MSFRAISVTLLDSLRLGVERHAKAAGDAVSLPFIELLPIILDMVSKFIPMLAACKQPIPPVPVVPPALTAVGVQPDTWKQAYLSKHAAMESVSGTGFTRFAINNAVREVKKSQHVKRKQALPIAMSALEAARDNTAEALAIGLQDVKNNARALGL